MIAKKPAISNKQSRFRTLLSRLKIFFSAPPPEEDESHAKTRYRNAELVCDDDDTHGFPITRLDYALDAIGCYKWQGNYEETKAKIIKEICPGHILDWGEPVYDEKTMTHDSEGNTIGCRGITCGECWNEEVDND